MDVSDPMHRAVLAAPDDDTVRLVYADYLDERGLDPWRARLIRGTPGAEYHVFRHSQRNWIPLDGTAVPDDVMGDLLDLLAPFNPTRFGLGDPGVTVRNGFVESLSAYTAMVTTNLEWMFRREPIVRVRLVDLQPRDAAVQGYGALVRAPAYTFLRGEPPYAGGLPAQFYDRLPTACRWAPVPLWAALEGASEAVVLCGREAAGLGEFGWVPPRRTET